MADGKVRESRNRQSKMCRARNIVQGDAVVCPVTPEIVNLQTARLLLTHDSPIFEKRLVRFAQKPIGQIPRSAFTTYYQDNTLRKN